MTQSFGFSSYFQPFKKEASLRVKFGLIKLQQLDTDSGLLKQSPLRSRHQIPFRGGSRAVILTDPGRSTLLSVAAAFVSSSAFSMVVMESTY